MQHFLVPTDFSETAFSALQYAVALAKHTKSDITILHTYTDKQNEPKIAEQLAQLQHEIMQHTTQVINMTSVAIVGDFIEVLTNLLKEKTFATIIMGMKGLRSINMAWLGMKELETVENFWVGSHTTKVLETVKIPVLVVPKAAKFRSLQQLTLAIDTKKDYLPEVFIPLTKLATYFQSNLNIVTIRLRDEQKNEENEELQLKKVRKWVGNEIPCSFKVVIADEIQAGLRYYISQENNQDMLVMVTRKKDFFEKLFGISTTQQMVYSTTTPVLVLHNHSTI